MTVKRSEIQRVIACCFENTLTILVPVLNLLFPIFLWEENHNQRCFFPNFAKSPLYYSILLLHFITPFGYSSCHGAVGSVSAWQTRGSGFEPVLRRYIFGGKYPGAFLFPFVSFLAYSWQVLQNRTYSWHSWFCLVSYQESQCFFLYLPLFELLELSLAFSKTVEVVKFCRF